jgi:nicotinamide mononucleotide transporter
MPSARFSALAGRAADHVEAGLTAAAMLTVTAAYTALSAALIADHAFNGYEFVGTWAGLTCVWLSRTRNILCWPWGILSVLALGMFFREIGLPGQQWLNWGFFLVIQIWAWPHWAFGGKNRSELPVTLMTWPERALALAAMTAGTIVAYALIGLVAPGSKFPFLDALVVAASVVAQVLLGRKAVESWLLWLGPVNLLSMALFLLAGAYTLTALYAAFFVHAAFALRAWRKAARADLRTA